MKDGSLSLSLSQSLLASAFQVIKNKIQFTKELLRSNFKIIITFHEPQSSIQMNRDLGSQLSFWWTHTAFMGLGALYPFPYTSRGQPERGQPALSFLIAQGRTRWGIYLFLHIWPSGIIIKDRMRIQNNCAHVTIFTTAGEVNTHPPCCCGPHDHSPSLTALRLETRLHPLHSPKVIWQSSETNDIACF